MRRYVAIGVFTLLGSFAAQAADLVVVDDAAPIDTSLVNSSIYVQLLGGGALAGSGDTYFNGVYASTSDIDAGYAIAGTIGVVVMDGISVEADVLYTKRDFTGNDNTNSSTSLMGNLKYTAQLNDMFSVYGALGVGLIGYEQAFVNDAFTQSGLGYQVIAGVGAKLTETISAVAEYRHQNTFDRVVSEENSSVSYQIPTSAVLVGVKLAF